MRLTLILVVLCTAGFAAGFADPAVYDTFGFSLNNLLADPLVLITSIFLHGSIEHLLSNVLVLVFFGFAVEKELGWRKTTTIFFLGAFAGDIISIFAYAPDMIGVGASAGIFALIGAGILVKPMDMEMYPLAMPVPLAVIGIGYALYNVFGLISGIDPDISYIAHFGGLFVGTVLGMRHKGWKKHLKVTLAIFIVMIVIPLLWMLLR